MGRPLLLRAPGRWWPERITALRDRLTSSPEFRRWAAANPFTRPIARQRARALFDLCAGFVYSQVLLACVRLRLFEVLQERPATTAELAYRLSLPAEAAGRLLRAACALQLCEPRPGGRYGLGVLGLSMVDNPGLAAMVEHHALVYSDLRDPVALLRGEGPSTALAHYWPYAGRGQDHALGDSDTRPYTELMSATQALVATEVLEAYPLAPHACLLDVGGGDGTFIAAAAARAPHLRVMVFDLPAVAAQARARIEAAGLASRATAVGGDLFVDPLPQGADIASLVRVLHDHDDPAALSILRAIRMALPPGGRLLIAEPMAQTPGAEPVGDAYFGFYLMAMGRGRPRTVQQISGLLETAGFSGIRPVATQIPLIASIVLAQAPTKSVNPN
jgi:demethylspheroidene O-methyltransferase